jgi:hypothetical protein
MDVRQRDLGRCQPHEIIFGIVVDVVGKLGQLRRADKAL